MKNVISVFSIILFMGVISMASISCTDSSAKVQIEEEAVKANTVSSDPIMAYYFHSTRRCKTCKAVESVAKETIDENYKGKVTFELINRDEEKDNPLIEKYEVDGQTLLFVKGDKVLDLTNDAFMYARSNPDKLKSKIKKAVDYLL